MAGPVQKFTEKGIEVAVWERDGAKGPYKSFTIGKRYKDAATGEWKDSRSYFGSELQILHALIGMALDAVGEGRGPDRPRSEEQQTQRPAAQAPAAGADGGGW